MQRPCMSLQVRILMLTSPNFQLVRSRLRTSPVLTGRSANITLETRSRLRAYPARNSLYAPQIGIMFNARRHRRRYLVQADRLHDIKGVKYKRKQFYASQILAAQALRDDITGPRCPCIIWTILLTLSQSLGVVVTFMKKAAKLFFKVTNFQGFLQAITSQKSIV